MRAITPASTESIIRIASGRMDCASTASVTPSRSNIGNTLGPSWMP
jgi:hypothetical protein